MNEWDWSDEALARIEREFIKQYGTPVEKARIAILHDSPVWGDGGDDIQ